MKVVVIEGRFVIHYCILECVLPFKHHTSIDSLLSKIPLNSFLEDRWKNWKSVVPISAKQNIPRGNRKFYIPGYRDVLDLLKDEIEDRNQVYLDLIENNNTLLIRDYNHLAAKIKLKTNQIKQNKWIELCSSIDPKSSDTKLWRLVHALNQDTLSPSISNTFKDNSGNPLTDKSGIANHFAPHYSSTAKLNFDLQDKIIARKSRLTRNLEKSKLSHNIFSKPFQKHQLEASSHLDPTKAPGPDNITGPMLKKLSSHAKLELLSIFNYSWSSSILPKEWKHATITHIHKPGKPENHPTNYRPISLTSIPCKIMEHMILNRLTFYLNLNNLLDPHQRALKNIKA
ncbi:hypothetical protein LAZ67_X004161 [Cordylochernes scorpioides]|uniref:Uncharacterized protein n=1 Tax=Cordylochernes scorpioides TaxID=51811 RepID=A0ABY6LUM9_9ARAC|nr:hypothetical protein LAZ67_X004161 [Cordylochernes scorpioides]